MTGDIRVEYNCLKKLHYSEDHDNLSCSKRSCQMSHLSRHCYVCQMSYFTHSQFRRLSHLSYGYCQSYVVVTTNVAMWLLQTLECDYCPKLLQCGYYQCYSMVVFNAAFGLLRNPHCSLHHCNSVLAANIVSIVNIILTILHNLIL